MKNYSVVKANELVEARFKLNLQSQRLILACIAKLDPTQKIPKTMKLSAQEFEEFTGIENARQVLYKAADKLFEASIIIRDNEKEREIRWIQDKAKRLDGSEVEITWSDKITKYISQLTHKFTKYKLKNIGKLNSQHSIRIYEMLAQFQNTEAKVKTVSVDEFKKVLGLENQYHNFKGLNQRVIKPCLQELNRHSNFDIQLHLIKKTRTVTHLQFYFDYKETQPIVKV